MDPSRERLKLIVRNLKLLVDALESEVYSDVDAYNNSKAFSPKIADYDEVFEDDEWWSVTRIKLQSPMFIFVDEEVWKHRCI